MLWRNSALYLVAVVPDVEIPVVLRAGVIINHGEAATDGAKQFELIEDRLAPLKPLRSLEDLNKGKLDFLPPSAGSIITDRMEICNRENDKSTEDRSQE